MKALRRSLSVLLLTAPIAAFGSEVATSDPWAGLSVNEVGVSVGESPADWPAPKLDSVRLIKSVLVPMRDGVRLSTDLYVPVGAKPPLPVVQIRLPYDKNRYLGFRKPGSIAMFFAGHGYVVAIQDMRGRFESEGDYVVSRADREDGYDTVDWLANQPWSNGKVGTYGCSYLGENQIQLSATRHPNHAAAIPQAAGGGYAGTYRPFMTVTGGANDLASGLGWFRRAGMKVFYRPPEGTTDAEFQRLVDYFDPVPKLPELDFQEAFWTLPMIDAIGEGVPTDWEDFVSHGPADPYWKSLNYAWDDDRFDVPALHVNSWYDGGVNETMILFNLFRTNAVSARGRDHQYVIVSPTDHCRSERATENTVVGERELGDARFDYLRIYLDWFEHWLKGVDNDILEMPRVQYYLMGANEWRSAPTWPLPGTEFTTYHLHSDGRANSRQGDGRLDTTPPKTEPADRFTYDPGSPVPSMGGPICCISAEAAPAGGYDQSEVELRNDVLVYTTPPLEQGLDVTGPIEAVLYVSSSAPDTDFTAKLVDVYPDGRAFNVQEGILRARYREGYEQTVWMEPHGVYEVRISLHATANYFGPGHRIRLEVSSSNFPRFDRNLNTGGKNYDELEWEVTDNTVHHSTRYPSHVVLPIVPTRE